MAALPVASACRLRYNAMNPADISEILPTIEQQSTRFVQITPTKPKQNFESTAFQKIFYRKRSMKELLEQRTALCIGLGLTSARKQTMNLNPAAIAANFCLIFTDGPSQLDEYTWTILEDRGTIYGFLASEEKYIPHCKACNYAVYLSLRGNSGRITCSNRKCRIQLLSEFELSTRGKTQTQQKEETKRVSRSASQVGEDRGAKSEEKQENATVQELEMIKRAAKRIVQ